MANQQIVDYIKAQSARGTPLDIIRSSLGSVGWKEGDIQEAVTAASPAPAASLSSPPASAQFASTEFSAERKPASPSPQIPAANQVPGAAPNEPAVQAGLSAPVITTDIFQPKRPVAPKVAEENIPISEQPIKFAGPGAPRKNLIMMIAGGAVIVVLAALLGYLFVSANALKSRVAALTSENADLSARATSLAKDKNDLSGQLSSLSDEKKELETYLSFFIGPPAGSTEPVNITITGKLSGNDKAGYTLLASRGVALIIKNSKDPKLAEPLKMLAGSDVVITGSFLPGSRDVTAVSINSKTTP